jgi:peptidyl-prolyl cis-trans isomerase C
MNDHFSQSTQDPMSGTASGTAATFQSTRSRTPGIKKRAAALGLVLVLVPAAAYAMYAAASASGVNFASLLPAQSVAPQNSKGTVSASGSSIPDRVVAVVNGTSVSEAEITAAGISNAVSRAQLVDDYVNKTLMAQQAQSNPTAELNARLERARRELLANAWVQDTSQKIQSSLTQQDMQDVYDKEIKDSMFARYKLSFVRGATAEEAQSQRTDWMVLKTDRGEEWLTTDVIPYQMGSLVATLKKGDATQSALAVRDGFLRIRVDDIREGKKPSFEELKPRITEVLLGRKLQLALQELRGRADIRIK